MNTDKPNRQARKEGQKVLLWTLRAIQGSSGKRLDVRDEKFEFKRQAYRAAEDVRNRLATDTRPAHMVPIRRFGQMYLVGP